jgi:hypothetical protein
VSSYFKLKHLSSVLQMSSSPGIVCIRILAHRCLVQLFIQSAFPKSDANLFEWVGTIEGPTGTVRVCSLNDVTPLVIQISIMEGCHLKSRYTFRPIIPTSHRSSNSNLPVFTLMLILHQAQSAWTYFRFVSSFMASLDKADLFFFITSG